MINIDEILSEDVLPTNMTSSVAAPDSKPLFSTSTVAGKTCIEVDTNTFHRCNWGKQKFSRWKNYIDDENLRTFVQKHYNTNDELLIKDATSGAIVHFKRG